MRFQILVATLIGLLSCTMGYSQNVVPQPVFEPTTIDSKVIIGYGVAIGDVDGDKRPDILLADKQQIVWYQNPSWQRHIIAENLTRRDNVCIAARDIDGDGKVEVAIGGEWNPGDTVNSGSVHYLIPPDDRKQKWRPVQLHHEPVVHRMRWIRMSTNQFALIVAPLHGKGNSGGKGKGVRLLAYHPPSDPARDWKTELLDDSFHVTHNFDILPSANQNSEAVLWYGREGAKRILWKDGKWKANTIPSIKGGGEIRAGKSASHQEFFTTIEPFHGSELVVYQSSGSDLTSSPDGNTPLQRKVIDDNLSQGHAIASADLLGTGSHQIVAGWRNPNRDGKVGLKIYAQLDSGEWKAFVLDDNTMACEDLRVADLDGDGLLDIVAAGRSTHNLKIYFNKTRRN